MVETGETFSEPVEPGDTLSDLKKKIFKSHNFPPVTQYFRFCDRCGLIRRLMPR